MCQSPHVQDTAQRPKFGESVIPESTTIQEQGTTLQKHQWGDPHWFKPMGSSNLSSVFAQVFHRNSSEFSSNFHSVGSSNVTSDVKT